MKEIYQYVFSKYPHVLKSNTEACIETWNEVARRKGLPELSMDMKQIIRSAKPESITRARREFSPSTPEQLKEEERYHQEYSKSNPSSY